MVVMIFDIIWRIVISVVVIACVCQIQILTNQMEGE